VRRQRTWRSVWARLSPSRLLVLSFALLVLVGTLGFRLVPGLAIAAPLSWTDALFMATSAVCVTGLAVVDPATELTFAGQLWILVLVQLGGLGLLTLTSGILLTIGRRLSLRHEALLHASDGGAPSVDYRALVRRVLRFTFGIEAAGAALLWAAWAPTLGARDAAWPAAFHAVSAFCNAGFSVIPGGFLTQARLPVPLVVTMTLIVLGGLGFLTLDELSQRVRRGRRAGGGRHAAWLSLHTRLVIVTTIALLVVGTIGFAIFEWDRTLAGLPLRSRLLNALFGSVTARTAGFNTVDYADVGAPTALMTMVLMFIGGAPGSTAGGVKTTTLALLVVLALSRLLGRRNVSAFHRTIPEETLGRAAGLMVLATTVLGLGVLLLVTVDPGAASQSRFLAYMFEAVSAFATVGLSANLTPDLSPDARIVVVGLMFVGRVGIMTAAAALALGPRSVPFRYAKEDVAIG
jgi:trk system potassium uptake protein